ncbi:hypothetical protein [Salidesulfovibrio brasiliensis]|uniref:hypothetical protein n=1 Tax=Salidesulfovibrio brasiliensis TaxID=221711 RepID=UPI0006D0D088|nr:hypothetical protein [Salidesulfovibrio brasiliensis]
MEVRYTLQAVLRADDLVGLFASVGWSSANFPEELERAMRRSHRVVSAWAGTELIGLANTISDGCMAAYVPTWRCGPSGRGRALGAR